MIPRPVFSTLVVAMVVLPMIAIALTGFGRLLQAMGDASGGHVCSRLAQASAILWSLDMMMVVVAMALSTWARSGHAADEHSSDEPPLE